MSSTTSLAPSGNVAAPSFVQPTQSDQIVSFNLQNTSAASIAPQYVTLGQTFAVGAVQPGQNLVATIDGKQYAVQMDPKTFNSDGSVKMAVLTVDAPALAADSTTSVMLSTSTSASPTTTTSLADALKKYSLSASLNITANQGGATGTQTIDIAQDVAKALANGTASIWMDGPLAQEAVVSIPVTGSLRIEADVTAYANGTISANLQFNNDAAMTASGGTITYSAAVTQNGKTVLTQPSLTQYQYQDWSATVGTTPSSAGLNVQENIAYLEKTGVVPNYDTQYGISSGLISGGNSNEASQIASPTLGQPLQPDGITQYMPGVGGRGDIGPTTQYNAEWLITQNAITAQYAETQAGNGDGAIPWHFYDPTNSGGTFLTPGTPGAGNIWTDGRGGPGSYTTGLTQQISNSTGWALDQAHQPDLAYDAYLQTGNVQDLEEVNAQASFSLSNQWPGSRVVTDPVTGVKYNDIITTGEQVRGAAWSLRQVDEAAFINPAGSADKTYFMKAAVDNWTYLDSMIPTWTAQEGQAHGYLMGAYGNNNGTMAPWQQDYLASSTIEAAQMGIKGAMTFLKWSANYLVGRFFAETQGFNPQNAFTYNMSVGTSTTMDTTWAQIEKGTVAIGQSNVGNNWAHAIGDYGALALQTLSGIISVSTSSPAGAAALGSYKYQAIQAYAWTLSSGAPYIFPNQTAGSTPQFEIVPRLDNGQLLSDGNITISTDPNNVILKPNVAGQNALITAGSGNDVLVGGTGINVLQGGSGADTLIGGANGNYIYAGSGDSTVIAGGGATFIQASSTDLLAPGTGKDLFVVDAAASGAVTISGFNPALDHLDIVDGSGTSVSGSQLLAIEKTATSMAGGVLYRVSANETIFVESSVPGSASWFSEQNQALTVSGAISGGLLQTGATTSGSGSSGGTSSSGGSSSGGGGYSPPAVTSIAGGAYATIPGAANVAFVDSISGSAVNATRTVQTETVSMTGGSNTIDAIGGPGAGQYPTYGNVVMTGDNNTMSVTGGSVSVVGSGDSISVPYTFGSLRITLSGQNDTVTTTSFTSPVLDIQGSHNVASFNSESVTDTIGGSSNTVSAGTYSILDVTGTSDKVTLLGETRATVSGAGDTINATSGAHDITAVNKTGAIDVFQVGGSSTNSVTISGFNPSVDRISVLDASGQPISASAIDQVVASATTISGSMVKLNAGATILYLDLAAPGSVSSSWFGIQPSTETLDGGTVLQNGNSQTILGAYANVTDSVSGSAIDARRTHQQETVTVSGSADTINAVGAGGANNFPTYGNLVLSGNNDVVSVTAGTTTDTGRGNTIVVPWQFGGGNIVELGTDATITAGANTSIPINIEGSGNTATINAQSALQTVGGSNNTVTAGVYSRIDLTGTGDTLKVSGESAVTVSGALSGTMPADTIRATGFDNIFTDGGRNLISIPGGSWNSTVTAAEGHDTVVVGPASPGGSNRLAIIGGAGSVDLQDINSQRTITMTAGAGPVTATGAANGSLFIGGTDGGNYLAASGISTLVGNGSSNTLVGGAGSEVFDASTMTGASNTILFQPITGAGNDTINGFGFTGAHNQIVLQSGLSITGQDTVSIGGMKGVILNLSDGSRITLTNFSGSMTTTLTS